MKSTLLTLALFGILTLGFVSCSQEEIAPSGEIEVNGASKNTSTVDGVTIEKRR